MTVDAEEDNLCLHFRARLEHDHELRYRQQPSFTRLTASDSELLDLIAMESSCAKPLHDHLILSHFNLGSKKQDGCPAADDSEDDEHDDEAADENC